jgi:hypothetical protein
LLDGEKVGEVANGKTFVLNVRPGRYQLAARMDYVKSAPFVVDARAGHISIVQLALPELADVGAQFAGLLGKASYFSWKLIE